MKKILLSLGTIATVAAPVVAVVSCGSSNELSKEKGIANGLTNFYPFSSKVKSDFKRRIENAKSSKELEEIRNEIDSVGQPLKDNQDNMRVPINKGQGDIEGYYKLDEAAIKNYKDRIAKATNQGQIDSIVAEAQKQNDDIDLKERIKVDFDSFMNDDDMDPKFYLNRDYGVGVANMKDATSEENCRVAHEALLKKINDPSVSKASEDDFVIVRDGIPNLFFPKDAEEMVWTDMSKDDQPKITYKRIKLDSQGIPTIDVYKNDVKTNENVTIQKVNPNDCGIVLTDFSGSYHVDGVKNKGAFESNQIIIDFLNHSTQVLDINSKKWIDIKNMKKLLKLL